MRYCRFEMVAMPTIFWKIIHNFPAGKPFLSFPELQRLLQFYALLWRSRKKKPKTFTSLPIIAVQHLSHTAQSLPFSSRAGCGTSNTKIWLIVMKCSHCSEVSVLAEPRTKAWEQKRTACLPALLTSLLPAGEQLIKPTFKNSYVKQRGKQKKTPVSIRHNC